MGKIVIAIAASLLLGANVVHAAEKWGVAELKIAQDSALAGYKEKTGDELFAAVSGFSIERNASGTSGRAKVSYIDEEGIKKTVSFFCHVHEGADIDCH